jgi:hypothetical protein
MQNFPSIPSDVIGGVAHFRFTRLSDASAFTVSDSVVELDDLSDISENWFNGYSTQDELKFTDESSQGENGISFNKVLEGFYPGDSKQVLQLFNEMAGNYFILYMVDNDGLEKIIGSVEEPLLFTFSHTSANPRGKKGYSYQFTGSGREKSPVWETSESSSSSVPSSSSSSS